MDLPAIEGTLNHKDMRRGWYLRFSKNWAYFIAIMKRRFWESYIHRDKAAVGRKSQKRGLRRHEDKHYFIIQDLVFGKDGVFTFVKVHNKITGRNRDTIGKRDIAGFHMNRIKININSYTIEPHKHIGLFPEYYPHIDGYTLLNKS